MKRRSAGRSSALPAMWSGPAISGSSAFSGTKTVPPDFCVRSTPWSKNCPNSVNHELYGGERPTSVVTFGMKSVSCAGVQPSGTFGVSLVHGRAGSPRNVRCGLPAASIAAGFVAVWSTIRLLITRGCESMTAPRF